MDEAAPQAATDLSWEDQRLLNVLQAMWDGDYSIGYDPRHGWWAVRVGVAGPLIAEPDGEQLGKALEADSGAWQ